MKRIFYLALLAIAVCFFLVACPNPKLPTVTKVSGPEGAINQASSTFTFSGSSPGGTIVKYEYRKDGGSWTDHGMNTSYTWNGYSQGPHTFEVRVKDSRDLYSIPVTWAFTYSPSGPNRPPNEPQLASPSNGAQTQPYDGLVLSWVGGDPDGDAVTYDVYFGKTNPPTIADFKGNFTSTNFYTGPLDQSTAYFWRVVARDSKGAETEGWTWYFITGPTGILGENFSTWPISHISGPYGDWEYAKIGNIDNAQIVARTHDENHDDTHIYYKGSDEGKLVFYNCSFKPFTKGCYIYTVYFGHDTLNPFNPPIPPVPLWWYEGRSIVVGLKQTGSNALTSYTAAMTGVAYLDGEICVYCFDKTQGQVKVHTLPQNTWDTVYVYFDLAAGTGSANVHDGPKTYFSFDPIPSSEGIAFSTGTPSADFAWCGIYYDDVQILVNDVGYAP